MNDIVSIAESLISAAVSNKYGVRDSSDTAQVVPQIIHQIRSDTLDECLRRLSPAVSSTIDITNQTIVLVLISRFWSMSPFLSRPLSILNSCLSGTPNQVIFRSTEYVKDFGGVVPTPMSEAPGRLDELERLCAVLVPQLINGPRKLQTDFLAYVFGSLIRIHPFEDGNGRTARFFVFYALACWNLPLFPIPKVRNDSAWMDALESAVKSNCEPLSAELYTRLGSVLSPDA